jgi:hypothetical protein
VPDTTKVYDSARGSLADIYSDVPTEGMGGLMAQVAARERALSQGHVEQARAGALEDLQDRKVRAQEGRAFQVQNAISTYRQDQKKVGRQMGALAGDAAAFRLGAFQDLMRDEDQMAMERARIRISRQAERRQQRQTQADITGIDPRTGQLTADERNRQRDDALARQREQRQAAKDAKGGGPSAGERSKHRDIVGEIQEAAAQARRLRKGGDKWGEIGQVMTLPRNEKNPFGGYGQLVTKAALELSRGGKISQSTMRALKARGMMPRRAPSGWRSRSGGESVRRAGDRAVNVLGNLGI